MVNTLILAIATNALFPDESVVGLGAVQNDVVVWNVENKEKLIYTSWFPVLRGAGNSESPTVNHLRPSLRQSALRSTGI